MLRNKTLTFQFIIFRSICEIRYIKISYLTNNGVFNLFIFILSACVLPTRTYVQCMHVWCPHRTKRALGHMEMELWI